MDIEEVGKWQIRPLGERETITAFTCGDSDIDDYITNESVLYQVEQAELTCTCGGHECLTQKLKVWQDLLKKPQSYEEKMQDVSFNE